MKYFLSLIAGFLLCIGLNFSAYYFSPFRSFPPLAYQIDSMYDLKLRRAAETESPRVVIIAGSSGLYGTSAKMLSGELKVPAVNMSSAVAVELDYMLYNAEAVLKKGDIVFLALEYVYYGSDHGVNDMNAAIAFHRDKGYILQLPLISKMEWMFREPTSKLYEGWSLPREADAEKQREAAELIDRNLNEYGDARGHSAANQHAGGQAFLENKALDIGKCTDPMESKAAWARIAKFVRWCDAHGVKVLASFPPTLYHPEYDAPESLAAQQRLVDRYRELGVATLGNPRDFMWEGRRFYDSDYHLNEEAMAERTMLLAPMIAPYLIRNP